MNISRWIVSKWSSWSREEGFTDLVDLRIGARVKTRFGEGVITGGSINIRCDVPYMSKRNKSKNIGCTVKIEDIEKA